MRISNLVSYFHPDGTPTDEGLKFFQALDRRLSEFEAFQEAIAQIAPPAGGATQDAEARAALSAIIAAG